MGGVRPYRCEKGEPVPLALLIARAGGATWPIKALDDANQPHRVAFSSESVSGIKAAVATGLAVGVVARSTVEGSMHVLDNDTAFRHCLTQSYA